jgi:general secretion pathway protein G
MNRHGTVKRACERGYTLIELLVVLAVLGLLAAIAAPPMEHYFARGQASAARVETAIVAAGLHLFQSDVGRYPTTQEGLAALLKSPPEVENWSGPYVRGPANLIDPWGRHFVYRAPGQRGPFDLFSLGPRSGKNR